MSAQGPPSPGFPDYRVFPDCPECKGHGWVNSMNGQPFVTQGEIGDAREYCARAMPCHTCWKRKAKDRGEAWAQ